MKFITTILPLAALTSAFVIPDEQLTRQIVVESEKSSSFLERLQGNIEGVWSGIEETFEDAVAFSENALDSAISAATDASKKAASSFECHASMMRFEIQEWLDSADLTLEDVDVLDGHEKKPHHPPHRGPPHRGPHHGPHQKPNKTVYELIASSKYTTKLAKLIDEYPDLVKELNGTKANYTVFAPTDAAFEKIPKHDKKPSKEFIKKVIAYHVSADFYPAGRLLISHTIPTIFGEKALGGEPQRLRVSLGLKGLGINFYSRIVAANIVCTRTLSLSHRQS
jgi:hypothetical protein